MTNIKITWYEFVSFCVSNIPDPRISTFMYILVCDEKPTFNKFGMFAIKLKNEHIVCNFSKNVNLVDTGQNLKY